MNAQLAIRSLAATIVETKNKYFFNVAHPRRHNYDSGYNYHINVLVLVYVFAKNLFLFLHLHKNVSEKKEGIHETTNTRISDDEN